MKKYIIAIDGPAASGKSTTSKELAKKLKYVYIDTGAMYRACGLQSQIENIEISDLNKLSKMMDEIDVKIEYSEAGNKIFLNNKEVTQRIRENDVSRLASEIAVIEIVRTKMTNLQRKLGENGGIIMDGRDIGTVVFPNADFKFFMDANIETRAKRRYEEFLEKGQNVDLEKLIEEMKWRDKNDSSREIAPLKPADDSIIIDTSNLTIEQQVEYIYDYIKKTTKTSL